MLVPKPQDDTRPLQAVRVADFLEKHPASTLLHRPRAQPDLFMPS